MTELEQNILVNQATIMSGIDVLINVNNDIPPAIKGMLHKSLDDAITRSICIVSRKDSLE